MIKAKHFLIMIALGSSLSVLSLANDHSTDKRAVRQAARAECAKAEGVTLPEHGKRPDGPPSDEMKAKMDKIHACMEAKGFKHHPHKHRGGHGPREEKSLDSDAGDKKSDSSSSIEE